MRDTSEWVQFAAAALSGMNIHTSMDPRMYAKVAAAIADAMMKERERG